MTRGEQYMMHGIIGYLCLIFGGVIGLHRFYFRRWFTGILYVLTAGFCGIGIIVDVILMPGWIEEKVDPNFEQS